MGSEITYSCIPFKDLANEDLYSILQLRSEVFVVEQQCIYLDADGYDQQALHVCGRQDGKLLWYTRLLPPGCKYEGASIGRVVTNPAVRRTGIGRPLMEQSIAYCREHWPSSDITISAQHYLESFSQGLGFTTRTEPYMEDEIPHVEMTLANNDSVSNA